MKRIEHFWVILLLCLTIGCLAFTDNLDQDNREELFLSSQFDESLSADRIQNPSYDAFVFSMHFKTHQSWDDFHSFLGTLESEFDDLYWMSPRSISSLTSISENNIFFKKSQRLKLMQEGNALFFVHFDEQTPKKRARLVELINQQGTKLEIKIAWAGMPYLNAELGLMSIEIKKIVMPALFISVFILLWFFLRSFLLTLITFLPSLFGVGISLVLIKAFWGFSTMITTLVPILVFLVLQSITLHLTCGALYYQNFSEAWREKKKAIYLALLTTVLGLLTLVFSDIPAIRQFSITSSSSLVLSAIVAIVFLHQFDFSHYKSSIKNFDFLHRSFVSTKKLQVLILAIICLFGTWSWTHILFQAEALYFFPKDSSIVQNWRTTENRLGGLPLLDIHLRKDNLHTVNDLVNISLIEEKLIKGLPNNYSLVSPNQIVQEANLQYSGSPDLPSSLIAYDALLSRVPKYFRPALQDDLYTMSILGPTLPTQEYLLWLEQVDTLLKENKLDITFGGLYYWLMRSQDNLIRSMAQSFIFGISLVTCFVFFMLRSFRSSFLFLLVNIIPALSTLSIFYLLGKTLNVASITTFSISFGLIVDSTLHLMIHYKKHGHARTQFIEKTIFSPMWIVTIVMVFGFSLLSFHMFAPVGDFGLAMGLTIFFGFLLDYIVLPSFEEKKHPLSI